MNWCDAKVFFLSKPSEVDEDQLRERLGKLILARVCILSLVLTSVAFEILVLEKNLQFAKLLFAFFGTIYAVSLVNLWWLRSTSSVKSLGYLQLFSDILLVTLASYITSPLVIVSLYLVVVASAGLALNNHGAITLASLAGMCFAVVAAGILPGFDASRYSSDPTEIIAVYLSLLAVSLLSGHFSKQLALKTKIAKSSAASIDDLHNENERILEGVSDGIITLDLDSTITGINEAARAIMGLAELSSTDFLGHSIENALEKHGIEGFSPVIGQTKDVIAEVSLRSPGRTDEVHLNCAMRKIHSGSGMQRGRMLIFSDQSKLRSAEHTLNMHERMAALLADPKVETETMSTGSGNHQIIGTSQGMKNIYALLQKVSSSEASVLISGESGTGKELIARAIHANSNRSAESFVAINCGAIPENLIESELFGHKKGAFTGAVNDSIGLFRQAEGGTIFLDEVGELPLHLQSKLLRVLQEKTVRAVGATTDIPIEVRIVAATNKSLKKEVEANRFRDDLFYRLNVINIELPPLRDRKEDIPLLITHFVEDFSDSYERTPVVSPEATQALLDYDFPGNIRELENIIERALVLGGQAILPDHLPAEVLNGSASTSKVPEKVYSESTSFPIDLDSELESIERKYLESALEESEGVKKKAAELLGMNFRSFRYRLKKYSMNQSED